MGGLALAAWVAAAGTPAGGSPGVPASSVTTLGASSARYCVTGYAPNDAVTIRNERTGATASISTNNRGSGCADVPVAVVCNGPAQPIVADGTAADGNPGTSVARAGLPAGSASCGGSAAADRPGIGAGSTRWTALDEALLAIGVAGCAGLVVIAVMLVRRRRATSAG